MHNDCVLGALDEVGAARYLNVSRSFLRQSRTTGDRPGHAPGPRYVKVGRMVRYRITDLEAWLEQHTTEPKALPQVA